jgi:hypothetical protein
MYIHLTNYSLNKKNSHFDGIKHKLRLSDYLPAGQSGSIFTSVTEKGAYTKGCTTIWKEIEDIVIKTVITVQP